MVCFSDSSEQAPPVLEGGFVDEILYDLNDSLVGGGDLGSNLGVLGDEAERGHHHHPVDGDHQEGRVVGLDEYLVDLAGPGGVGEHPVGVGKGSPAQLEFGGLVGALPLIPHQWDWD